MNVCDKYYYKPTCFALQHTSDVLICNNRLAYNGKLVKYFRTSLNSFLITKQPFAVAVQKLRFPNMQNRQTLFLFFEIGNRLTLIKINEVQLK